MQSAESQPKYTEDAHDVKLGIPQYGHIIRSLQLVVSGQYEYSRAAVSYVGLV